MAKKVIFNQFSEVKGAAGTFYTDSLGTYVVCLNSEKGSFPVIFENNPSGYKAKFPKDFSDADMALYTEVLQSVMKSTSYPDIGYERGIILPSAEDIDYPNEYPLRKFVPRTMKPGVTDLSEKQYRKLLNKYYPDTTVITGTDLDISKSLEYEPFADMVQNYHNRPEFSYELNPTEHRLMKGIAQGTIKFVGLQGAPGTGKSTCLQVIAMKLGLPYRQSSGNFDDNDQLVGSFSVVEEEGEEKVRFLAGPLLECYEYGGLYIVDEANFTNARVYATLQAMTDDSSTFHEKNSKRVITRHPNFILGFTWNPKAKNSAPFNEALFNRFNMVIDYYKATAKDILEKMMKIFPDADKGFMEKLASVPGPVETWAKQNNSTGYCSIRQLESFYKSISVNNFSFDEFLEEFRLRVMNPVCSCNSYNIEKIDAICSSEEYKDMLNDLYSLYGGGEVHAVDYDWILSGGGATANNSTDDIADDIDDFMKSFSNSL